MQTPRPQRRSGRLWLVAMSSLTSLLIFTSCAPESAPTSRECAGLECELQELADQAGFHVRLPEAVPAYLVFEEARFDSEAGSVTLSYVHRDGSMERLLIIQRPVGEASPFSLAAFYPPEEIENIEAGPFLAQFVQGVYSGGSFDPTVSNQQFVWSLDGMEFWISATLPSETAKSTLARIANSMDE